MCSLRVCRMVGEVCALRVSRWCFGFEHFGHAQKGNWTSCEGVCLRYESRMTAATSAGLCSVRPAILDGVSQTFGRTLGKFMTFKVIVRENVSFSIFASFFRAVVGAELPGIGAELPGIGAELPVHPPTLPGTPGHFRQKRVCSPGLPRGFKDWGGITRPPTYPPRDAWPFSTKKGLQPRSTKRFQTISNIPPAILGHAASRK